MGFVHALLLVNITFVPYRPDIDTVQTGKSTYTWLAIIIIFLPLVNGWIVDNDEEGLFLFSTSSSPSTSLVRLPVDDDAPAVTHDIDQCPCHGGFCCYCCGCSAEQWMNEWLCRHLVSTHKRGNCLLYELPAPNYGLRMSSVCLLRDTIIVPWRCEILKKSSCRCRNDFSRIVVGLHWILFYR